MEKPGLKDISITIDSLRADNSSAKALGHLGEWQEGLRTGSLDILLTCADSRVVLPSGLIVVRSVAAALTPEIGASFFDERFPSRNNILLLHEPCGGLGVKAEQQAQPDFPIGPYSGEFVARYVPDADPFNDGMITGGRMANTSERPTLVLLERHETGEILPLGGSVPLAEARQLFSPFPLRLKEAMQKAQAADPHFAEHQRIINPQAVLVTTELSGLERFPETLGKTPNTVFTITVAPEMFESAVPGGTAKIPFDQIHYAFDNTLKNKEGDPEKPFARLANGGILIIESHSPKQLLNLANEILNRPYMQEWVSNPNNKVILLYSKLGKIVDAFPAGDMEGFFTRRQ